MQGDAPAAAPRPRIRVLAPMALALFLCGFLLRTPWQGGNALDLRPYLDGPQPAPRVGEALRDLARRSALGESESAFSWFLPLLSGLAAVVLFLALESFLRRRWRVPHEVAALVPAAAFTALPSQAAFHAVRGGETLLLALTVFFAGVWLALGASRLRVALGVLTALGSVVLHPALAGLLPLVAGAAGSGGLGLPGRRVLALGAGVLLAGGAALLAGGGCLPAPPAHAAIEAERLRWALESGLAAPALSLETAPRTLLPTGHEALTGAWPVAAGLAAWLLVLAWSALTAGIRPVAVLALGAALAALLPPLTLPGWIPGEKGLLLVPLVALSAAAALLLSTLRGAGPRSALLGLALGVVLAAFVVEYPLSSGTPGGRGAMARRRMSVFQLPRMAVGAGDAFNPYAEPDPARLLLFMDDVYHDPRFGPSDSAIPMSSAALVRLLGTGRSAALDPAWLEERRASLARESRAMPLDLAQEEKKTFLNLQPLEDRLPALAARLRPAVVAEQYGLALAEMQEMIPAALEVCLDPAARHPRVLRFTDEFRTLLTRGAEIASGIGSEKDAVPLREALVELTARNPRTLAILGRELFEAGRAAEARPVLEEALRRGEERGDVLWSVTRGTLGRLRLAAGEASAGLTDLHKGWADLVGPAGSGQRPLQTITYPEGLDFWLVMEVLLARYEAVREHDPSFLAQAERDLMRPLEFTLSFGTRRVPALMMRGRIALLSGDAPGAKSWLREMRETKAKSVVERAGGPQGRFDFPRWRRLGLRSLLEALGPEGDAAERAAIEAELAPLGG